MFGFVFDVGGVPYGAWREPGLFLRAVLPNLKFVDFYSLNDLQFVEFCEVIVDLVNFEIMDAICNQVILFLYSEVM